MLFGECIVLLSVKEKMYKTQLQELCHKRRWGLPKYSAMKDGPDHMPSFKASVHVNGATFTSLGAFTSLKEAHNQAAMHAFLNFSSDMDHFCKNQLHNNAPKNNLDPPEFTCKIEDLPSDSHYKATVQVNVQSSESPAFFNTAKEVEQAAAQLDLMPLSPDIFEKGDSDSFMTSLLKLTEREGFCKPTCKTMQAGSPHMPTFFSTVEIEGVEFHGKGSRSMQQAEEDAAKIAYIALKGYELLDLYLKETSLANVKISNEVQNPCFQQSPEEEIMDNRCSSSCKPVSSS
ncbi:double-stranded RNA-binding protein 1 [Cajanus cajan]|uniref:double-stranded RNA-binding protein 1 n=1 Tax=Cajanus cajan TaxID=3821 RepID=UPI0010FB12D6|nr:double-stranded RNA-binding protein 1 [Cajanus cajan]